MAAVHRREKTVVPYTIKMGYIEAQLINTLMVMFRAGVHDQQWEVASNVCGAAGLTRQEAEVVFKNAMEIAKRRVGA